MAVRVASPPSRRRLRHLAALGAACAYAAALVVGWEIVTRAFEPEAVPATAAPPAETVPAPTVNAETLTARALAARARQSVFQLQGAGGARGSAFVAWTDRGRSYLLTAHRAVAGILADGGRSVFIERGDRFWSGRIVAADKQAGLVVVRVDTRLADPLWQDEQTVHLGPGDRATVVPVGPDAAFGEGTVATVSKARLEVRAGVDDLNVGAPVVAANGRLAGVVVATTPAGVNRVAPVELACWKIRRCGSG